ncbi:MAG: winged helix-turn-helix domain-containing protein [Pseudomonadota bacterium]
MSRIPSPSNSKPIGIITHGEFSFTLDDATLRRAGEVVNLTLRSASMLRTLLQHQGQEVSKQMLIEQVWQNRSVSDAAITKRVQELRQALDDDARAPCHIETCHGRGYRLKSEWALGQQNLSQYLFPHSRLASEIFSHWRSRDGHAVDIVLGEVEAGQNQAALEISELGHRNQIPVGLGRCNPGNGYQPLLDALQGVLRDSERQALEIVEDEMSSGAAFAEQLLQGSLPMSGAILVILDAHHATMPLLDAIVRIKKRSEGNWLLVLAGHEQAELKRWARYHRDLVRWRNHALNRLDSRQIDHLTATHIGSAVDEFSAWLTKLTGGVPSLLERCMEQLARNGSSTVASNTQHPARAQLASYVFGQMEERYARLLSLATVLPNRFLVEDLAALADLTSQELRQLIDPLTNLYGWLQVDAGYAGFNDPIFRAAAEKLLLAFERDRLKKRLVNLRR